eukprot:821238-Prymnesium_polylepis.2
MTCLGVFTHSLMLRSEIKRSSCGERPNVEAAGTVTSRRQHLPVRHEVRPEEVRCLGPPPAVHFRPLPAAVRTVCPLSALLTHCIYAESSIT